jgi:hypothetical protein
MEQREEKSEGEERGEGRQFQRQQKSIGFFTYPSSVDVLEGKTTTERKTEPKFIVNNRPRHVRKA